MEESQLIHESPSATVPESLAIPELSAIPCGPKSCEHYHGKNFIHIYNYTEETQLDHTVLGDDIYYMFHLIELDMIDSILKRMPDTDFFICNGQGQYHDNYIPIRANIVNTFPVRKHYLYRVQMLVGPAYTHEYINRNELAVMDMLKMMLRCRLGRFGRDMVIAGRGDVDHARQVGKQT